MKKFLFVLMAIAICGCSKEKMAGFEYDELVSRNSELKNQIEEKKKVLEDINIYPDGVYLVTLEIKQSTFTLDLFEHAKNSMNAVEITVPVAKEFYLSCKIGDKLSDNFKWGSFLRDGDLSKLNVTVKNKRFEDAK